MEGVWRKYGYVMDVVSLRRENGHFTEVLN